MRICEVRFVCYIIIAHTQIEVIGDIEEIIVDDIVAVTMVTTVNTAQQEANVTSVTCHKYVCCIK